MRIKVANTHDTFKIYPVTDIHQICHINRVRWDSLSVFSE